MRTDALLERGLRYSPCVTDAAIAEKRAPDAGLCSTCVHARRVESSQGSVFYLCELSFTDPRFTKYPRLPVISCDGFKKKQ